jgi:hypothetical protein
MLAREAAAGAVNTRSPAVSAWRAWFPAPRLRWLVPASAVALALGLYVAVKPGPTEPGLQETAVPASAPVPAQAPEFTMAGRLEEKTQPKAVVEAAPAPVEGKRAAKGAAAQPETVALARPTQTAEGQAANLALAAPPVAERQMAAAPAASDLVPAAEVGKAKGRSEGGLDSAWAEADLVVLARAVVPGPDQPADVTILEVFKRRDGTPPSQRLTVLGVGGATKAETGSSRADSGRAALQPGQEYVLFLRASAEVANAFRVPDGSSIYRLQGEAVTVGNQASPDPILTRASLLAGLRERAGAKR